MMKTIKSVSIMVGLCLLLTILGCGGGGGSSSSSTSSGSAASSSGTGSLSMSLTDSTTDQYRAVYVTIREVQVHFDGDGDGAGQWKVVSSPNKIFDLLTLVNGVMESLGVADLPSGHYTQMRLIIGEDISGVDNKDDENLNGDTHAETGFANYIIKKDNTVHELKVPSGDRTGIKLVHPFDIVAGVTVDLILDFDAAKSVVERGKSGKWNLKPTIKVIGVKEKATLAGKVRDEETGDPLPGVLVSAQIYDPVAADEKNRVVVVTATLTASDNAATEADEAGQYLMYLKPGDYTIVATAEDYNSQSAAYTAVLGAMVRQDFSLKPVGENKGTISGEVLLADGEMEFVTVSFRQGIANPVKEIEVASLSVGSGGPFSQTLPYGTYKLVLFMPGHDTQVLADVKLDANTFNISDPFDFQ